MTKAIIIIAMLFNVAVCDTRKMGDIFQVLNPCVAASVSSQENDISS